MAKEGSTVCGLMDTLATTISVALQYGVPLRDLVNKFAHVRFEPSGFTGNQEIPIAKSIVDYIFRWLGSRFLSDEDKQQRSGYSLRAVTGRLHGPLRRGRSAVSHRRLLRRAPPPTPTLDVDQSRDRGRTDVRRAQGDGRRRRARRGAEAEPTASSR